MNRLNHRKIALPLIVMNEKKQQYSESLFFYSENQNHCVTLKKECCEMVVM